MVPAPRDKCPQPVGAQTFRTCPKLDMARKTPPRPSAQILELHSRPAFSGWPFTVAELAKGFEISERTVRRILKGPPPPPSDAPLTVKDVAFRLRCRHQKVKDFIQSGQLAARNIGTAAPGLVGSFRGRRWRSSFGARTKRPGHQTDSAATLKLILTQVPSSQPLPGRLDAVGPLTVDGRHGLVIGLAHNLVDDVLAHRPSGEDGFNRPP